MQDLDRKVRRGRERLAQDVDTAALVPISTEKADQLGILEERIKKLLEEIENLGEEGKVDEAEALMKQVSSCCLTHTSSAVRDNALWRTCHVSNNNSLPVSHGGRDIASSLTSSSVSLQPGKWLLGNLILQTAHCFETKFLVQINLEGGLVIPFPKVLGLNYWVQADFLNAEKTLVMQQVSSERGVILSQEKKMALCEICGSFLVANDATERTHSHMTGKQHVGFGLVRDYLVEYQVG